MNAKRAWSVICLIFAVAFSWSAYRQLQDHYHSSGQAIGRFLPALFHLGVGAILWFQGRTQKIPGRVRSSPETCPVCGAAVPTGARACKECGTDERAGWDEEKTRYDG